MHSPVSKYRRVITFLRLVGRVFVAFLVAQLFGFKLFGFKFGFKFGLIFGFALISPDGFSGFRKASRR